jgi:hypothetical protein
MTEGGEKNVQNRKLHKRKKLLLHSINALHTLRQERKINKTQLDDGMMIN